MRVIWARPQKSAHSELKDSRSPVRAGHALEKEGAGMAGSAR